MVEDKTVKPGLITFLAKREGDEHAALWAIPVDGGEARRMLTHQTDISDYSFSPEGTQVAFLAKPKEDEKIETLREKGFRAKVVEEQHRPVRVWIGKPQGRRPLP